MASRFVVYVIESRHRSKRGKWRMCRPHGSRLKARTDLRLWRVYTPRYEFRIRRYVPEVEA